MSQNTAQPALAAEVQNFHRRGGRLRALQRSRPDKTPFCRRRRAPVTAGSPLARAKALLHPGHPLLPAPKSASRRNLDFFPPRRAPPRRRSSPATAEELPLAAGSPLHPRQKAVLEQALSRRHRKPRPRRRGSFAAAAEDRRPRRRNPRPQSRSAFEPRRGARTSGRTPPAPAARIFVRAPSKSRSDQSGGGIGASDSPGVSPCPRFRGRPRRLAA